MAGRVGSTIRRLLDERRLIKTNLGHEAVQKELKGAQYDLEKAKKSLEEKDFKWATVKAYYSMFHAARALLYSAGYRERSHAALATALKELYVHSGNLSQDAMDDFENAMDLREQADYGLAFSKDAAHRVTRDAARFLAITADILGLKPTG